MRSLSRHGGDGSDDETGGVASGALEGGVLSLSDGDEQVNMLFPEAAPPPLHHV